MDSECESEWNDTSNPERGRNGTRKRNQESIGTVIPNGVRNHIRTDKQMQSESNWNGTRIHIQFGPRIESEMEPESLRKRTRNMNRNDSTT